ncbi:leucine-rich repeat and immunoglobulin-like domain-containing nogo receptor-interacting protein 1-B [Haliotis rubra]|uniref:leucine-rich repeat and immunoglobulin-like domain-containing nogo receptor-interacting protein 1-B n=1 Tax=Haliotis rubra TaxID=36100 RepID=UPI001EE5EF3F|nr:leucine-rich repeat and immunoglobulin-like domain-containing nogo receptor-interacting protein 1-B [Haliotis rubra]
MMSSGNLVLLLCVCLCVQLAAGQVGCPSGCRCTTSNNAMTCQRLSIFPTYIPSYITTAYFYYSNFREIPSGRFHGSPNLKSISFTYGSLGTIQSCAFSDIQASVTFSRVNITNIRGGAFSNLDKNINRQITFSYSNITTIDSYAFHNLTGVNSLTFSYAKIFTIRPYAFKDIIYSRSLKIQYTNITNLMSYAFDLPPYSFQSSQITRGSVMNIGCNTLEELTSVQYLTTPCNCDNVELYRRGTRFSGRQHCFAPNQIQNLTPGSLNRCQRPDVSVPSACPGSFNNVDTGVTSTVRPPIPTSGNCTREQIRLQLANQNYREALACFRFNFDMSDNNLSFKFDMTLN